jgi:hypothetical protein
MLGKTTNPKLQKVEQAVQQQVPPDQMSAFERIVVAGEKIMYSPQTRHMLQSQLGKNGDPTEIAGEGVAKLMGIMLQKSKGTMPMKAAIPAAQVLLCEGLDFMEQAGLVQVSDEVIAQATKAMMAYLLQIFGFSKDKIDQYMHAGMAAQGNQPGGTMPASADAGGGAQPPAAGGIIGAARGAA